jgi:hypothetical protein
MEVDNVEELRKVEGLSLEELEAQRVELLPDREEMNHLAIVNIGSAAAAFQGAQAGQGQANFNVFGD